MLSSLGARRERSRSPPEGHPPLKVFIQAKEKAQHVNESVTRHQTQQPESKLESHQCHETSVPKIVVQEYREVKMMSPMSYTDARAVTHHWTEDKPESSEQKLLQAETQGLILQQQLPREQPQVEQHCGVHHYQVQQQGEACVEVQTQVKQASEHPEQTSSIASPVKKLPLSTQELESKKTQAMKHRPWLQKPATSEQKSPVSEEGSSQEHVLEQIRQAQPQPSAARPNFVARGPQEPQQLQKEQQKQAKQFQYVEQQQVQDLEQEEVKCHQGQQHQKRESTEVQQEQQQQRQPVVRLSDPSSDTKFKSQTLSTQLHKQMKMQKSQGAIRLEVQSMSVPHTTTVLQEPLKDMSQFQTSVSETHSQTQFHVPSQVQPQACIPAGPQPSTLAHSLVPEPAVAHAQTWAQVRPSSPMQASLHGHIQAPVPAHIQLRSHPQSWAPVRPPSPKPQTHVQSQAHAQSPPQGPTQPQSMVQSQIHPVSQAQTHHQSKTELQNRTQSTIQVQTNSQSRIQLQTQALPMTQAQAAHSQPLTQQTQARVAAEVQSQSHFQPLTQYSTLVRPAVLHPGHNSQSQIHSWTQVRASSSISIPHPQATGQSPRYLQGYNQGQSPLQQWIPEQASQNQAMAPHSQPYPQQIGQAPQSQPYPAVLVPPQWPQAAPQLGPQIGHPGYSMGPSYTQPQMQTLLQTWAQTQPQVIPQSPTYQQSQMRGYDMFHIQPRVQQQTWVQAPPQYHPQVYPLPRHPLQTQHHPETQIQTQIHPSQSQSPHQRHHLHVSQPQLQTQLQGQSQKLVQGKQQVQPQLNLQLHHSPPQSKQVSQFHQIQSPAQLTTESPEKNKPPPQLVPKPEVQSTVQPQIQARPQPITEPKFPTQPMTQSPIKGELLSQSNLQAQTEPLSEAQSPTQPKPQTASSLEGQSQTNTKVQSLAQPMAHSLPQPKPESPPQSKHPKPQTLLSQVNVLPQPVAESPDPCVTPPSLAQAPPQAYSEAYTKAQALARNGFEEAKHCLQQHIMETINVFQDKRISPEQMSLKEVNTFTHNHCVKQSLSE